MNTLYIWSIAALGSLMGCKQSAESTNLQNADPARETSASEPVHGGHTKHWGYSSQIIVPPENWSEIDTRCKVDGKQSPMNITNTALTSSGTKRKLTFDYRPTKFEVRHNGHSIVFSPIDKNLLVHDSDGIAYRLLQFHLHTKSEHTLDGKQMAAEVHFVHSRTDDPDNAPMESRNLLVLGILFSDGGQQRHPAIPDRLAEIATRQEEIKIHPMMTAEVNPIADQNLLDDLIYYHGSLTTPPCTENVDWYVSTRVLETTADDIKNLASAIGFDNSRPVGGRNL